MSLDLFHQPPPPLSIPPTPLPSKACLYHQSAPITSAEQRASLGNRWVPFVISQGTSPAALQHAPRGNITWLMGGGSLIMALTWKTCFSLSALLPTSSSPVR